MSSAILAATLALIGFVITQSILKFVIEPIQEQKRLIGEVAFALVFYANVHVDAAPSDLARSGELERVTERTEEPRKALRSLASRLRSTIFTIPFYDVFAFFGFAPKLSDVLAASDQLVGWSNSLVSRDASETIRRREEIISEKLGIKRRLEGKRP